MDSGKPDLERIKKELKQFKAEKNATKIARSTPIGIKFDEIIAWLEKDEAKDLHQERNVYIGKIMHFLLQINQLSIKIPDAKYISIPLKDMKIIGKLLNLLILHGIYEVVPSKYLIPLEKRHLKDFRLVSKLQMIQFDSSLLDYILDKFDEIFKTDSDLKDLILVGVGLTDMLNICLVLYLETNDLGYLEKLTRLESFSSTYQLLSFYTLLMNYSADASMKKYLKVTKLPQLIMKKNGIESLIDLVLGLRENEEIDMIRLQYISTLLISSKPADMKEIDYYGNLLNQIYCSLVMVNRPIMVTIMVELTLLLNQQIPRLVDTFIFEKIWVSFNPIIEIGDDKIILTEGIDLNNAFNVTLSLVRCLKKSNEDLLLKLLTPIINQLFWFADFQRAKDKDYEIILNLIKNSILLESNTSLIDSIISNLILPLNSNFFHSEDQLVSIKFDTKESRDSNALMMEYFSKIDFSIDTLIILIKKIVEIDEQRLNEIISLVLTKSLNNSRNQIGLDGEDALSSLNKLTNLKVLQSITKEFKDDIEKNPLVLINFLNDILSSYFSSCVKPDLKIVPQDVDSDDDDDDDDLGSDENELLSLVPIFELISDWVPSNSNERESLVDLQTTISKNLALIPESLHDISLGIVNIKTNDLKPKTITDDDRLGTILKQINDPSPSIKVYALDELTNLTITSPKITFKYTMGLMVSQLRDQEPFVYLNAIKNITKLMQNDKSQLKPVLEMFNSSKSIDEKLRLAESVNKFINSQAGTLTNDEISLMMNEFLVMIKPDSKLDQRLRMSSLSLLGSLCFVIGMGVIPYLNDIIDIINGILTFEKDTKSVEIRRACIHLYNDIISGEKGIEIVSDYGQSIDTILKYVHEKDDDLLVTQLAWETLVNIDQQFERKFTI